MSNVRYRVFTLLILTALMFPIVADAGSVVNISAPALDRWMYPFNGTPGTKTSAPTFGSLNETDFDERDAQFLLGFDTAAAGIPSGAGAPNLKVLSVTLTTTVEGGTFNYDSSEDPRQSYLDPGDAGYIADTDTGRPVEVFGVGFRSGYSELVFGALADFAAPGFEEDEQFSLPGPPAPNVRVAYAAGFDGGGALIDVSNNIDSLNEGAAGFDPNPWAIGQTPLAAGAAVPAGTTFTFDIDASDPDIQSYFQQALSNGVVGLAVTSLHPAEFGGPPTYPIWQTRDDAGGTAPSLTIEVALLGDISMDGEVDIADFTLWADAFGDTGAGLIEDVTMDGEVDIADFTLWADNFGSTYGPAGGIASASVAVPEPASLSLLAIGALFVVITARGLRRRRGRS